MFPDNQCFKPLHQQCPYQCFTMKCLLQPNLNLHCCNLHSFWRRWICGSPKLELWNPKSHDKWPRLKNNKVSDIKTQVWPNLLFRVFFFRKGIETIKGRKQIHFQTYADFLRKSQIWSNLEPLVKIIIQNLPSLRFHIK